MHPPKDIYWLVISITSAEIAEGGSSCSVISSTTRLAAFGTHNKGQGSYKPSCGRDDRAWWTIFRYFNRNTRNHYFIDILWWVQVFLNSNYVSWSQGNIKWMNSQGSIVSTLLLHMGKCSQASSTLYCNRYGINDHN